MCELMTDLEKDLRQWYSESNGNKKVENCWEAMAGMPHAKLDFHLLGWFRSSLLYLNPLIMLGVINWLLIFTNFLHCLFRCFCNREMGW